MQTEDNPGAADAPLRVVICDDAVLNRECLALALVSHGIEAEGVGDLPALFSQLDRGIPEVFVLNVGMPDSATLIKVAMDLGPGVRIVATGLSEDRESEIVAFAESGVEGLHLRTESLDELLTVIRNQSEEEAVCSARISAILARHVYSLVGRINSNVELKEPELTDREGQIMGMLEEGLSNQQIASRLGVTIHTVKNHAHSLFNKLGVSSRAEAVAAHRAMRSQNFGAP